MTNRVRNPDHHVEKRELIDRYVLLAWRCERDSRMWFTYTTNEPAYCPYCGNHIVTERKI